MDDQVTNLGQRFGIDYVGHISSDQEPHQKTEVTNRFNENQYAMLYVTPERFQNEGFQSALKTMSDDGLLSSIVIDEAHCVSEWGHDFRPAYLTLSRTIDSFCRSASGHIPPTMAVTGTASRDVLEDVQDILDIQGDDALVDTSDLDRPELKFTVKKIPGIKEDEEKIQHLVKYVTEKLPGEMESLSVDLRVPKDDFFRANQGEKTQSGLIFCANVVNFKTGTWAVAEKLTAELPLVIPTNSSKIPAKYGEARFSKEEWNEQCAQNAEDFKDNIKPVMVVTKGYGMGIDKENIRYTVHTELTPSIETFYQEAGRAGRDRQPSKCILFFRVADEEKSRAMLAAEHTEDQ
ncbi:MAG: helicase-related protein, partial [Longimicrobiales bacterium]